MGCEVREELGEGSNGATVPSSLWWIAGEEVVNVVSGFVRLWELPWIGDYPAMAIDNFVKFA
jgi:hypothetical protein